MTQPLLEAETNAVVVALGVRIHLLNAGKITRGIDIVFRAFDRIDERKNGARQPVRRARIRTQPRSRQRVLPRDAVAGDVNSRIFRIAANPDVALLIASIGGVEQPAARHFALVRHVVLVRLHRV